MNLTKARELREQRARMVSEARTAYDASPKTKDDLAKFNTAMDAADEVKKQIDAEERFDAMDGEVRHGAPPRERIGNQADEGTRVEHVRQFRTALQRHKSELRIASRNGSAPFDAAAFRAKLPAEVRATVDSLNGEFWGAMKSYLAVGDGSLAPETRAILAGGRADLRELGAGSVVERRDMGTGGGNALQGSGGGYFVPVGFVDEIEEAMKWYGDMLRAGTILNTATGQPLPYPTDNDTSNVGALLAEAAQVTEQDVSPGSIVFNAYKYTTKMIKVSLELLQDSAFDLESYCKERMAVRLGRILNTHFTTGTGSSQPNGIITAATAGPTAAGSSTNTGGSETGGTTIGTDDLVALEHSVDKAYRRGAAFMANDSTIKQLKQLKDKYGRPIWLPGLAINAPDTLLGYEYFTNNDMATVAVNAKTVLFGQLKKYLIREVKELAILKLVERYADYGQVAFVGFARYDGNLLDAGTHPVKYLVQAAS